MNVSEIIDGINEKKKSAGMTNQKIADASGVPKSTVDRILRKDPSSPSAQNLIDIANAVGYNFGRKISPPPEITPADLANPFVKYISELNEDRFARQKAYYEQTLAVRDRLISYLLAIIALLATYIIGKSLIDAAHPNVGFYRSNTPSAVIVGVAIMWGLVFVGIMVILKQRLNKDKN